MFRYFKRFLSKSPRNEDRRRIDAKKKAATLASKRDGIFGEAPSGSRELYLDLMKRCLTNCIYGDLEIPYIAPNEAVALREYCQQQGYLLIRDKTVDPSLITEGNYWPAFAHTMIGCKRLDNLQYCVETALRDGVKGDLIETGVWRGGASIFMRAILKAHGVTNRSVWVADSFCGLPKPDEKNYPADAGDPHYAIEMLAVSLEQVRDNFQRYGLLDHQVRFLKGWFKDTLPTAPIQQLAVARLDGDMYESTMDSLHSLYPKLSPGGFLIVDDFGALAPCRQAVTDYRREHGIQEEIVPVDWTGVYWRKFENL